MALAGARYICVIGSRVFPANGNQAIVSKPAKDAERFTIVAPIARAGEYTCYFLKLSS